MLSQLEHLLQGSPFTGASQSNALASILPKVVFPDPNGPAKR